MRYDFTTTPANFVWLLNIQALIWERSGTIVNPTDQFYRITGQYVSRPSVTHVPSN